MQKAFVDQPGIYSKELVDSQPLQLLTKADEYNVLVTGFSGRGPQKRQSDIRLWLDDPGMYLKFSLPSLRRYPSIVQYVKISVDDSLLVPLTPIEEMDWVAEEVYKVKEPIIYARTFVRAFLKAMGTQTITKKPRKRVRYWADLPKCLVL